MSFPFEELLPGNFITPLQKKYAVGKKSIDSHLVVSAPTNSGKSLIGEHCLLESIKINRISILVEPLRALAQEKFDELANKYSGDFSVSISTGDYRLLDEQYTNPPPHGE